MSRQVRGLLACGVVWLLLGCGATKHNSKPGEAAGGAPAESPAEKPAKTPDAPRHAGCETSVLVEESGVETCGTGDATYRHRAKVGTGCSYDPALVDTCSLSDCPGPYPICDQVDGETVCGTGCSQDADCEGNQICDCFGPGLGGKCRPTVCASDLDCAPDTWCTSFPTACGMQAAFACESPNDNCHSNADCTEPGALCVPIPMSANGWLRVCLPNTPCTP